MESGNIRTAIVSKTEWSTALRNIKWLACSRLRARFWESITAARGAIVEIIRWLKKILARKKSTSEKEASC